MKNLLCSLLLLTPFISKADWEVTWTNPSDGDIYLHDKSTIQIDNDLRTMWSAQRFSKSVDLGLGPLKHIVSQFAWDCKNSKIKHLAIIAYNFDGTVQMSKTFVDKNWEPIPPGTPMMDDFKIACKRK